MNLPSTNQFGTQCKMISAVLRELPAKMQNEILVPTINAASVPVANSMVLKAPTQTGALKASIAVKIQKYKDGGVTAFIGPNRRFVSRYGNRPSKYAHLVEFGHVAVSPDKGTTRRKGSATAIRFVPPKPFIRPAYDVSKLAVEQIVQDQLQKNIDMVRKRVVYGGK